MGSPLGPVLADIFMIELEKSLVPELTSNIQYILSVLNGFHNNIKFTVEEENDSVLPFFDILICRNESSIETTFYRKSTSNDIYLNWNVFSADTWKKETLKIHVERAYNVCSTDDFLDKELKFLVFHENNHYPKYFIKQMLKQPHCKQKEQELDKTNTNLNLNDVVEESILVKYQGKKGNFVIKSMKKK